MNSRTFQGCTHHAILTEPANLFVCHVKGSPRVARLGDSSTVLSLYLTLLTVQEQDPRPF